MLVDATNESEINTLRRLRCELANARDEVKLARQNSKDAHERLSEAMKTEEEAGRKLSTFAFGDGGTQI